jgi:hypothetical protein
MVIALPTRRRLGEPEAIVEVAPPHRAGFGAVAFERSHSMAANERMHPVAGSVVKVGDPSDQTSAGKGIQRGEIRVGDPLGGLPREVAGK